MMNALETAFLVGYGEATRAAYRHDLRAWFSWCGEHDVDPLMAQRVHVDAYARTLGEIGPKPRKPSEEPKPAKPATVARYLSTLSGFYRYAVAEDVVARNPVANVRRPTVGSDTVSTGLSRDELAALISAASEDSSRSLALVLLLGLNGLRVSEALGADVEDLSTERGHWVLRIKRKGGKTARTPLAPATTEAVESYVGERNTGPLFITGTEVRWHRSEAWRTLRRLAKVAVPEKAETLHPHDLRHAFVTLSLDAGASLRHVQDAAGHVDPRTTRRYDRARHNLDRHPTYALAGLVANAAVS
jgi:integrase/recombinase XerD